jgi:hypothetical protein
MRRDVNSVVNLVLMIASHRVYPIPTYDLACRPCDEIIGTEEGK